MGYYKIAFIKLQIDVRYLFASIKVDPLRYRREKNRSCVIVTLTTRQRLPNRLSYTGIVLAVYLTIRLRA